ncbi:MAG: TonB-dependent receptor [Saprospiraceae bacterium]
MRYTLLYIFITLLLLATSVASAESIFYEFPITVLDQTGEPLIGVNVYTDDYQFTATTDVDGKVTLVDIDNREEVNFTYVGFQSLKLPFYEIRQRGGKIRMLPEIEALQEVVVVGRRDDTPEDIPLTIENISRKQIEFLNPQTTADALEKQAGVFVQKSQMGGGSPVIRGFEANKVLLVLDGVRLNNAIYRNGHLQNAITVDPSILERIEVIFGPGSLTYGSEALGGVVHFRTRDPKLFFGDESGKQDYLMNTNASMRYASANQEFSGHVDINYGSKNWGSLTSISLSDFGHLRAGSVRPEAYPDFGKREFFATRDGVDQIKPNLTQGGEENFNLQRGTEYTQIDLLQKLRYQPSDKLYFVGNLQYSTSSDVPRYDALTEFGRDPSDLKWIEWYYGPQQRVLASLKTRVLAPTPMYDRATIIGAFQYIQEDRNKRKFTDSRLTFNNEDVFVYSLTGDFDKYLDSMRLKTLAYGFDINHNQVFSESGKTNVITGAISGGEPTRYPSGSSTMTTAAAYATYQLRTADSLITLNGGLRYTYAHLNALFGANDPIPWPEVYYTTGVGNGDGELTGAVGLTMNTPTGWQIRSIIGTAFRSPNVDDYAKIRVNSGYVTIPNPELGAEKSLNTELTLAKKIGQLTRISENEQRGFSTKISATGYYTRLTDAIVRKDFALPDGSTTLIIDEEINTTQANVNADRAFVYGFSGNLELNVNDTWILEGGINYTKGRKSFQDSLFIGSTDQLMAIDTLVPMGHIPPAYGRIGLTFQKNKFKLEGVVRFASAKPLEEYEIVQIAANEDGSLFLNRDGSSDNLDLATPDGTYDYTTYNVYGSYDLSERYTLTVALENITDIHYRPFASGVSAPGRNLIVSFRGRF